MLGWDQLLKDKGEIWAVSRWGELSKQHRIDFNPSDTWTGSRLGFVFKNSSQGLGYYRDWAGVIYEVGSLLQLQRARKGVGEYSVNDEVDVCILSDEGQSREWFPGLVRAKNGTGRQATYTCECKGKIEVGLILEFHFRRDSVYLAAAHALSHTHTLVCHNFSLLSCAARICSYPTLRRVATVGHAQSSYVALVFFC